MTNCKECNEEDKYGCPNCHGEGLDEMLVVAYGGGTNSTAMLVGFKEQGIMPDAIIFADTGGERPHTYEHLKVMQGWLKNNGFPEIITVKNEQPSKMGSLENMCIQRKILPAVAYGFKTCSVQYKIEPYDKYIKNQFPDVWKEGRLVKAIGIDFGETQRQRDSQDKHYKNYYPLIEWEWDREECIEAIDREGLPRPGKSSCFFCPNMKQHEIREMAVKYPDLMDRAIKIEENAELTTIKGLGRNYAWKDLIATEEMFPELYKEDVCGCYDGD